jgi:hypothetical protein
MHRHIGRGLFVARSLDEFEIAHQYNHLRVCSMFDIKKYTHGDQSDSDVEMPVIAFSQENGNGGCNSKRHPTGHAYH